MTLTIIAFILPIVGAVIGYFKLNKKHKKEIQEKDELIHALQTTVREMVILEGEKNAVDKSTKQNKKDRKNMSDDELNVAYSQQLPKLPKKQRKSKKV